MVQSDRIGLYFMLGTKACVQGREIRPICSSEYPDNLNCGLPPSVFHSPPSPSTSLLVVDRSRTLYVCSSMLAADSLARDRARQSLPDARLPCRARSPDSHTLQHEILARSLASFLPSCSATRHAWSDNNPASREAQRLRGLQRYKPPHYRRCQGGMTRWLPEIRISTE